MLVVQVGGWTFSLTSPRHAPASHLISERSPDWTWTRVVSSKSEYGDFPPTNLPIFLSPVNLSPCLLTAGVNVGHAITIASCRTYWKVDDGSHCMGFALIEITPKKVSTYKLGFSFHGLIKKKNVAREKFWKRDLILACLYWIERQSATALC
jgi:hypothetical protein